MSAARYRRPHVDIFTYRNGERKKSGGFRTIHSDSDSGYKKTTPGISTLSFATKSPPKHRITLSISNYLKTHKDVCRFRIYVDIEGQMPSL